MLLLLFVKKIREKIQFCIDHKRLNVVIKKDCYTISLIEEILAQLKVAKYFTQYNIRQVYHQIKMLKDSKAFTTFLSKFLAFQYLITLLDLYKN